MAFIRDKVKEYFNNKGDLSINTKQEKIKMMEKNIYLKRAESILRKNEKIRNQKKLVII